MSRSRPDLHGQAEFFQAPNETTSEVDVAAPFKIVGAEFLVRRLLFQDLVRSRHHGGCDGENRLLRATSTLESEKLCAEVRVPRAGGHPRDLDELGFEPRFARS